MAVKKGGLGKGLDSLIPSGAPKNKKNITEEKKQPVKVVEKVVEKIVEKPVEMKMKITEVEPNREQPRKNFDEDALLELAESIKQLVFCNHCWFRKRMITMKLLPGNADGELQNWQG